MAIEKPRGKHAKIEEVEDELDALGDEVDDPVEARTSAPADDDDPAKARISAPAQGESDTPAQGEPDTSEQAGDLDEEDASEAIDEAALDADATVALDPVAEDSADVTVALEPVDAEPTELLYAVGEAADGEGDDAADISADDTVALQPDLSGLDIPQIQIDEDTPVGFVPEFDVPKNRSRKVGKVIGITLGVLVGVVAIVYGVGVYAFSNWFLPNTTIGDMDISLKSSEEVAAMLDDVASDYTLDVVGDGFSYRTNAEDIGLSVNSTAIVRTMHEDLNSLMWPALIIEPSHDLAGRFEVEFKQALFQDSVQAAVDAFNETATPPTNATITFDEASNSFKVKPEELGTQLDSRAVLSAMAQGIGSLSPKVTLGEDQLLQPKIFSTDPKLVEAAELASNMTKAQLTLNLAGQEVGNVDAGELAQFVVMNEETYEVTLDEAGLDAWVADLANGYNTVGSSRTYTRPDGKVITVAGGVYGWEIDVEALRNAIIEGVKAGSSGVIDIPCIQTADVYNGPGTQDWGNRYVDVDLAEQYVRFYDWDGSLIWEAPCISGKPDGVHDTSVGVFYINQKQSPSKLEGWENGVKIYTSYVTYWMPFDGNAIGLHDADWQPSFGGTMYANGYGSHGCVNLPPASAAELYYIIQEGDVVVSHW